MCVLSSSITGVFVLTWCISHRRFVVGSRTASYADKKQHFLFIGLQCGRGLDYFISRISEQLGTAVDCSLALSSSLWILAG